MNDPQIKRFHSMKDLRLAAVLLLAVFANMGIWPAIGTHARAGEPDAAAPAFAPIRIGVLAHKEADICREMWQPTMDYLDKALPGSRFVLVPLKFEEIKAAVQNKSIDFLICNPAIYVDLEVKYGVSRMMTLRNLVGKQILSEFGGVVFCRADRRELQGLKDVRGQRLAAVAETSFGGWFMALREFRSSGIKPERDCSRLFFLDSHPAVVRAVLSGQADIGTVRTDTIERMAARGEIRMDDIRVIPAEAASGSRSAFPYLHSTRLYPEWPFAKLPDTDDGLSRDVSVALLSMPADSPAAKAAQSGGWDVCLDYTSVHDCLRELRLAPYEHYGRMSPLDMMRQYWPWLGPIAILIVSLSGALILLHGRQLAVKAVSGRNRLLLASAGEGICGVDINGNTTFTNPAADEILGYTAGELIGGNLHALTHPTKRDGSPCPIHECPIFMACNDGTVHQGNDEVFYRKDGSAIPVSYSSRPVVDRGKISGAVICFQDITEQKRTEEALKSSLSLLTAALESTADGLLIVNREGRVSRYNRKFAEMWNMPADILASCDDDVLLKHVMTQLADPEQFLGKVREMYFNPEKMSSDQIVFSDGRVFERHSQPQKIGENIVGRVWSFRDITEQKQIRKELLHINETLEQRVAQEVEKNMEQERMLIRQNRLAAMGEMVGNIAHQWRQPLNALGLVLFNIKDAFQFNTLDAAFLDQAVEDGNRLVQKMSTTISDFFNFFRSGKEIVAFSALEQIKEAIALVESGFGQCNIAIHVNAPRDLKLLGFPNEYSQVLLNLLSNAREAILAVHRPPSGRVDIVLDARNGKGCVSMADNGGGIPAGSLDKIFDPYFTTKESGTGLGLYMSKTIIERNMHGSITAKNIEGGAEFIVAAPLAEDGPRGPAYGDVSEPAGLIDDFSPENEPM